MEDEKKTFSEGVRPKDAKQDWDTGHCPWFIFGNEDSANYDIEKVKSWFKKKFGKKRKD